MNNSGTYTLVVEPTLDHNEIAINQAIQEVHSRGGGAVVLPYLMYKISGAIIIADDVCLRGMGMQSCFIYGGIAYDYSIRGNDNGTITNFRIQDLTIDATFTERASCMKLYNATDCVVERVCFKNVPAHGWGLKIGAPNAATAPVTNFGNQVIDCVFDGHQGSLEALLLFNAQDTWIIRPRFTNKTTVGPILGLWQKTYNTKIIDPVFRDNVGFCIYYSITCEDTLIDNMYAENCGTGIQGANVSDHGLFGETVAKRLQIKNPTFIGGTNSMTSTAIQLGAIDTVEVDHPKIEGYEVGIHFHAGNEAAHAPATNWVIKNPQIKNCNPNNNHHALHPAILFTSIGAFMNGRIEGGNIYDDQEVPTQRYALSFEGVHTWSGIQIEATSGISASTVRRSSGSTATLNE